MKETIFHCDVPNCKEASPREMDSGVSEREIRLDAQETRYEGNGFSLPRRDDLRFRKHLCVKHTIELGEPTKEWFKKTFPGEYKEEDSGK